MNWLAHLLLSRPDSAFQIGNLLPDLAPRQLLVGIGEEYQEGMRRHLQIDAFTDAHPVVRASWNRFQRPCRRYAGVLTDVFYDHFLTRDWAFYSKTPLSQFTSEFHRGLPAHRLALPALAFERLEHVRDDGLLMSYGELQGVRTALSRISCRLRRACDLTEAMQVLEDRYDEFHADFRQFFPELRGHVMS